MGYVVFLCEIIPAFIVLNCIFAWFKKNIFRIEMSVESYNSNYDLIRKYPWIGIVGLVAGVYILSSNFLILNLLGLFNLNAFPNDSTIFCYASYIDNGHEEILPCRVEKIGAEGDTYYYLDCIIRNGKAIDMSDYSANINLNKYENVYDNVKVKLINMKYEKYEPIIEAKGYVFKIADIFFATLNISCAIITFVVLKNKK